MIELPVQNAWKCKQLELIHVYPQGTTVKPQPTTKLNKAMQSHAPSRIGIGKARFSQGHLSSEMTADHCHTSQPALGRL
ncbi:hypothetical protein SMJ63A_60234 [Stenotrophomonas geniculata]